MDFVSFEIAKKLKEKGFKEKCIAYYWEKINEHTPSFVVEDKIPEDGLDLLELLSNHNRAEWSPFIDAPTIAQVLKWLREDKQIHVGIIFTGRDYTAWIQPLNNVDIPITINDCDNNNEATIAAIEYIINNLI